MLSEGMKQRLDSLQHWLKSNGVRDVKFFKAENWNSLSLDERAESVCLTLEALRDGKTTPHPGFSDSHKAVVMQ